MKRKVLRQAILVKPSELIKLGKELKKEQKELDDNLKLKKHERKENSFVVSIINKQPKCSDTWQFEKKNSEEE